jgi:N-acetylmuramoyl-L-alanine amidase
MGRIFISAAHGGKENGLLDPGSVAGGTTEAREMILLRDLIVAELRSRNVEVLAVPDDLSFQQTLDWINVRGRPDDVALEIHADSANNPQVRGVTVFYIANNEDRKKQAEMLLQKLIERVPRLPIRGGVQPDTSAGMGNLAFCRLVVTPSLVVQLGFLTNPDDRFILQNQRREMAIGLANGLTTWLRDVAGGIVETYPPISISINGRSYGEQGIIVSGNAYIPIDLVDLLGFDLSKDPNVRRINYRNVVFVKAIELRAYSVSVGWDTTTRTVVLNTVLKFCPGSLDRIMGHGSTDEKQLIQFLADNNPGAVNQYADLARYYREEASIEGISYDIAFCQMCLSTNFLRFGGNISPAQNNFAELGSVGGGPGGATFSSAQEGVRAQIQMLKAYASTEPLVQQEVPGIRFRFVTRGIAPLIDQLSGRWSADLNYGTQIIALVKRLYASAGLL